MRTDTTYIRICVKAFDSVERLMASGAYSLPEWTTWTDTTTPRTNRPVRFVWERCCNLPSCGVTHRRLHSAIGAHFLA